MKRLKTIVIRKLVIGLLSGGVLFGGCYPTDDIKPRREFFDKAEWHINNMKYTAGSLVTDGNANYKNIVNEELRLYNSGMVTNVDSTFRFGYSDFYVDHSGPVIHIQAENTVTNSSDDLIELLIIENLNDNLDNTWYAEIWFGTKGNRTGEFITLRSYFSDLDNGTRLSFTIIPLLGTQEFTGQFEINLK